MRFKVLEFNNEALINYAQNAIIGDCVLSVDSLTHITYYCIFVSENTGENALNAKWEKYITEDEIKQYKIHYLVDDGYDLIRDTALVKSTDECSAIEKLKDYIRSLGNEYFIHEVFSIEEFDDVIFSSKFVPSKTKISCRI